MIYRLHQYLCASAVLALVLALLEPRARAADAPRDKAIRAVLLFHIAQLTEWPKDAFANDTDPFVLGIVGQDPFGEVLSAAVKGETIRGRKIVIEHYDSATAIKKAHLLYISSSESRNLPDILKTVQDSATLTVSDIDRAERRGVMIHLYWDDGRAKMIINRDAVARKGLVLSPRLLGVAQAYP